MKNDRHNVTKEVLLRKVADCFSVVNLFDDGKYLFAVQHLFKKDSSNPAEYENGVIMDFHFHNGYELEVILSGTIKNTYHNKTEIMGANSFYIMSPDDIHEVSFADDMDTAILLNIGFDEFILSDSVKKALKCRTFPLCGQVSDEMIEYLGVTVEKLSKLNETISDKEIHNEILYKMFEAFIIYLMNVSTTEKDQKVIASSRGRTDMYEVIKYVREHYKEKITISEIAKRCGYSANYFNNKFKEITDKTLVEYISDMRMVEAYKRIVSSNDPIYSISSEVGYSNLTYFYKKFKEKFGCLPEELRKRSIKNTNDSLSK